MIVEKIVVILIEVVLAFMLSYRYIKRYAPENLIILPMLAFFSGLYISFTINKVYIPIHVQIFILVFSILIPFIATVLQYNNIIVTRKLLYYRMKYLYFAKEYQKTIQYIVKIVNMEGRKAEYLYILGLCYKNLKDFINARDSFALAVELDKNDYKSYYELGLILDETNKQESALAMYNKSLQINPYFYEAKEAMGICLTRQGRFKEAVRVYTKAIEKHPDSYEMYYNIAIINMELKDIDKAEQAFIKAGEIKPDLYTAFYNLGNINFIKKNYESAIEAYKNVLNSSIYGPKAYYRLAMIYAVKEDYIKSMSFLEYAIELEPKYIQKSLEEGAFNNMKNIIESYLNDKEELKKKEKERKNYMRETFKLFQKKEVDILDEFKSVDYSNRAEEKEKEVKHA